MKVGLADAKPDEIDWDRIVENWDLPFKKKIKSSAMNPCSQREIDEIAKGTRPGLGYTAPTKSNPVLNNNGLITRFEQINEVIPGLGNQLKRCLHRETQ